MYITPHIAPVLNPSCRRIFPAVLPQTKLPAAAAAVAGSHDIPPSAPNRSNISAPAADIAAVTMYPVAIPLTNGASREFPRFFRISSPGL